MKRIFMVGILILEVLLFSSCSGEDGYAVKKSGIEASPADIPVISKQLYRLDKLDRQIEQPKGICRFHDDIVVSDYGGHCLAVLDPEGGLLKKVGGLGSGKLEFSEPTALTVWEDKLYVLDAGNSRIQILDQEFQFAGEIILDVLSHFQGGSRYLDLAVDSEGRLYISTDSVGRDDAYLQVIENGEARRLEQPFTGYLTEYNGDVYAMDTLELYVKGGKEGGASGRNRLYRVSDREMTAICDLPNKITPADFIIQEDRVILISSLWGQLDCFSMEGQLEQPIAALPNQTINMYLCADGTNFYLSDSDQKKLYYVERLEEP